MKDQKIAQHSTFYNYTLIKKIPLTRTFSLACLYLNILLLSCDVVYFRLEGLIAYLIGIPAVALVQFILIIIVLQTTNESSRRQWAFRIILPCVGYLPNGFVALKSLYRVHAHLLLVGSAIIGIIYIWLPASYFNGFIFVHLGMLFPRLVILWRFKKLKSSGLVKFNEKDVSYYTS
jgi:hypothetical protein